MAANNFSLSANAAIVDPASGRPTPQFYQYLLGLNGVASDAVAGEVTTDPGSGLIGGGIVSDGISLSLDPADPRNVDHDGVSILAGVGLSGGGTIAVTRTIDLEDTAVTAGSYTLSNITVDQQGRITAAASGTAPAAAWGTITGTLSSQTDLQTALDAKADDATTMTAGAGLTGGGDLSANRTFDIGAGTGITVNANDVAISNTTVAAGSYTYSSLTVDAQGRLTAASSGAAPVPAITSVDNVVARFDGTAGSIQTSGVVIDDSNNITGAATFSIGTGLTGSQNIGVGTVGSAWPAGTSNVMEVTESLTATTGASRRGLNITQTATGTLGATSFVGLAFSTNWSSTGTCTTMNGVTGIIANTTIGTVTNAMAVNARVRNNSTGTITTGMGVNVVGPVNGGTITTLYGVFVAAQKIAGVTNGYAFYQAGAADYNAFAGLTRLGGVAAPTNPLSVTGDADISATLALGVFTVATLPAVAAGKKAFVSDALGPAFGAAVVGGGAVFTPVYSTAAGWFVG